MGTLNLGIVAHVDAGKTSLTERLLYATGLIDELGSVDAGSTQTDTLALERQRGITIKSAVVSFVVDGVTVELIDTPGHPDFIAEVERVLVVLDGAVLVVSAVEGVQSQTRILMRALRRLQIPTLIFINKIDRGLADPARVSRELGSKLGVAVVPVASHDGMDLAPDDPALIANLVDRLAEHDDMLLSAYVDDPKSVSYGRLRDTLARQTAQAHVYPVFFGSAMTGAGIDPLIRGIVGLLPANDGRAQCPVGGRVFKVERGPAGERIAYVRLFSGMLRVRDRVPVCGRDAKVTAISVFEGGAAVPTEVLGAGQIGRVWGLGHVRIGDSVGLATQSTVDRFFAPPSLETVVVPGWAGDKGAVLSALSQLAEQDPLINLRQDDIRDEVYVSLYGEVQKEVIQATLANDFGLEVTFRESTTIHIERPIGTGAAVEFKSKPPNPFLATVGLRVEPAPVNSGLTYRLEVELGSMPYAFMKTVEDTVTETMRQGLYGWQVTDCSVTLTHSGYWPRQSHMNAPFDKSMSSTGYDFRGLTPLVVMEALRRAGTTVCEPIHRFHLEIPTGALGSVPPVLARLGAVVLATTVRDEVCRLEGDVPAARVHDLERRLPALTRGEGLLESEFARYQPVRGPVPIRPRTDHNPLNRKEYLVHVVRRV